MEALGVLPAQHRAQNPPMLPAVFAHSRYLKGVPFTFYDGICVRFCPRRGSRKRFRRDPPVFLRGNRHFERRPGALARPGFVHAQRWILRPAVSENVVPALPAFGAQPFDSSVPPLEAAGAEVSGPVGVVSADDALGLPLRDPGRATGEFLKCCFGSPWPNQYRNELSLFRGYQANGQPAAVQRRLFHFHFGERASTENPVSMNALNLKGEKPVAIYCVGLAQRVPHKGAEFRKCRKESLI